MLNALNQGKKLLWVWPAKCLIALIFLSSCDEDKLGKPGFTGSSGELLIVCEDAIWFDIKDSVELWLQPNFPMLPQQEALFRVAHFTNSQMNDLLRRHRNILNIARSNKQKSSFKLYSERNSKEQVYLELTAYTSTEILELLKERKKQIIGILKAEERKRLESAYRKQISEDINIHLEKNFGLSLSIPVGANIAKSTDNFCWIKREREKSVGSTSHFIYQGIAIYIRPYLSDNQFTDSALYADRNFFLGANIPGPKPGTQMSTQTFIMPTHERILFDSKFAIESRGLWRTTKSFMGGPYVAITTLDPSGKNLITVEGFVHAPKFDKREYVKELEAMVYSLRFK
jgi:hypothetical protein